MKFLKKFSKAIWKNKRLIFVFIFSFLVYEFIAFPNNNEDPIAMYAFSHAIRMGEVPYRDFNIISTPLYAFLMSIGLFVFDNYLMFIIEQSVLVTVLFYFLFKLYDKKAWFILFGMCITNYFGFLPTYNFLCFFFIIILFYLEKNYSEKDYLIGIVIGLAILSKHTVGLSLLLPLTLICFKNLKKFGKRVLGIMMPCGLLLIYLVCNNALFDFINLSFLGLFDFGSNNSNLFGIYFYLALLLIVIMIYLIFKHPKDKHNYYFLCGYMFCFPLYDLLHFALFFNCFLVLLVQYGNFKSINYLSKLCIFISILHSSLYFVCVNSLGARFFTKLNHFNYMYNFKNDYNYDLKVNDFLDNYEAENVIFLSGYTMFYNIICDNEINYYDVLLYGNHGYNGTEMMINKIKSEKDVYIIVDYKRHEVVDKHSQYNKEIVDYIIENYEKIDRQYNFDIYYKE